MVFFKKWLQNQPKFLLHFLIHIDILILCSKFPTSIFQVTAILRISENFEKITSKLLQFFITKYTWSLTRF